MPVVRVLVGGLGAAAAGWGIVLLLDQGGENLRAALTWLVVGVVLHDGVVGPAVIGLTVLAALLLRRPVPPPVIVGLVVLATVSVTAIPVLGRFGAKSDNPSLLDRDYAAGWWAFAGLTLVIVVGALLVRRAPRRRRGAGRGTRAGG